jgi:hypothetical protein
MQFKKQTPFSKFTFTVIGKASGLTVRIQNLETIHQKQSDSPVIFLTPIPVASCEISSELQHFLVYTIP